MEGQEDSVIQRYLGWSDKQKRILTADDRADDLYTAVPGFTFEATELPHVSFAGAGHRCRL
jgi:hypothetical protein